MVPSATVTKTNVEDALKKDISNGRALFDKAEKEREENRANCLSEKDIKSLEKNLKVMVKRREDLDKALDDVDRERIFHFIMKFENSK